MADDSRIAKRIGDILTGSGLPIERRAEVAEELRGHLERAVEARLDAGMLECEAVDAALADFGPPDLIRGRLRRQQRMLDRRCALAEIRRSMWAVWVLVGMCGLYAGVIAVLHPLPMTPIMRCLWGLTLFAGFSIILISPVWWASLFHCRLVQRRPLSEYRFARSFLRGAGMGILFLACAMLWVPLWLMPFFPVVFESPESAHHLTVEFWHIWWIAVFGSPDRLFGLALAGLAVLGTGLSVAVFQRSRCVDESVFSDRWEAGDGSPGRSPRAQA